MPLLTSPFFIRARDECRVPHSSSGFIETYPFFLSDGTAALAVPIKGPIPIIDPNALISEQLRTFQAKNGNHKLMFKRTKGIITFQEAIFVTYLLHASQISTRFIGCQDYIEGMKIQPQASFHQPLSTSSFIFFGVSRLTKSSSHLANLEACHQPIPSWSRSPPADLLLKQKGLQPLHPTHAYERPYMASGVWTFS